VIPCQEQPERFLSHVASFAGQDGIVVITTMSAASVLAEICRRLIKPVFRARTADPAELLHSLVAFFKPDLLSLPGMSRLHEDWVLDNILHPWPRRCTFTVPEAIETLDGGFDWLGTSPAVFQDWRWYKSIPRDEKTWNDIGREQYRRWGAYLIDYRVTPGAEGGISRDLDAACEAALALQHGMWCGDSLDDLPRFLEALAEIRDMLAGPLPLTAASIGDYQKGMEALAGGADPGGADFGSFRSWFGRGQQYVSFVRSAA
jgi:hypothetical protein